MTPSDEARFWAKVDKSGDCWIWTACKIRGYGGFGLNRKLRLAHRVSYEMANGLIPAGLQLDHLCRTTACVNPDHLEAVTPRENQLRSNSISGQAARRTQCPQGHAYDLANTYIDSTRRRHCRACGRETMRKRRGVSHRQRRRDEMRKAVTAGRSSREIADQFGVTPTRGWQIRQELSR